MGFDGGDGGNGLTIQSSKNVWIDSSIVIRGIGGPGGYGYQGSGTRGDDGYSIYLTDTSYTTVNNSSLIGNYFSDSTSTLILFNVVGVNNEAENELPRFILHQNYPNPFNPSTKIKFQLTESGFTSLKVYDVLGNEVATIVNEEKPVGEYEVEFSIQNLQLTSGVYFYQLKAGNLVVSKKMVLLK